MIPEEGPATKNASGVKKLIFCSGKVYYDLTAARKEAGLEDVIAISRVEQVGCVYLPDCSVQAAGVEQVGCVY